MHCSVVTSHLARHGTILVSGSICDVTPITCMHVSAESFFLPSKFRYVFLLPCICTTGLVEALKVMRC